MVVDNLINIEKDY